MVSPRYSKGELKGVLEKGDEILGPTIVDHVRLLVVVISTYVPVASSSRVFWITKAWGLHEGDRVIRPRPHREAEVGLVEPWPVSRKIVHDQEKQRDAKQRTDLPEV